LLIASFEEPPLAISHISFTSRFCKPFRNAPEICIKCVLHHLSVSFRKVFFSPTKQKPQHGAGAFGNSQLLSVTSREDPSSGREEMTVSLPD
jgi:hypothetical protein